MEQRGWVLDGALAVGAAAISLSVASGFDRSGRFAGAQAVAIGCALAHTLPLVLRRRYPRAVLATSLAAGLGFAATGLPLVGLGIAIVVPVYTVAALCDRRTALAGLAATLAAMGCGALIVRSSMGPDTLVVNGLVLVGAWALGDQARRRREEAAVHADRARRLEQAEGELARRAVADERLRIARELHDVVAHSMSVIAVQAGTGRLVIDERPDMARDALATIETTSRAALVEMRRLLGVLRSDNDGSGGGDLVPAPGVGDLDALVADGAVDVSFTVEGERTPLPAGAELAAYRIVQEALTNVRKHAPEARAGVTLRYTGVELLIEVRNRAATGRAVGIGGHGLIGMRERAELYGGSLQAGLVDGDFVVTARIPYGTTS